ncbi:MAG: hypothetical protein IV100_12450 [Myxococcales bacterium]|nr:hypothetical protein [Myxococcales bacterium]
MVLPTASLDLDASLRKAVATAIAGCPHSRQTIADELTRLVGREVTETTLNAWTAPTKETHRFPAAYLPALVRVTGSLAPLMVLAEAAGAHVVDSQTMLLAERTKLERSIKAARKGLVAIDAALPEVEL